MHWLSLFPTDFASRINSSIQHPQDAELKSSATLDIHIRLLDTNDKPDRITFVNLFSEFITLSIQDIDCSQMTGSTMKVPITFSCTGGNDGSNNDMIIKAYAVRGSQMSCAGEITVVKNHAINVCKEKNVALVAVNVSLGSTVFPGQTILDYQRDSKNIYRAMHQCLLYGSVNNLTGSNALNFVSNHYFQVTYTNDLTVIDKNSLLDDLTLRLHQQFPGVYENYAKVFYVNAGFGSSGGISGVTRDFHSEISACFNTVIHFATTPPHELLHSFGLRHLNDPNSPHNFRDVYHTNCVMSYSDRQPFSTWHWQWHIVNGNI